MKSSSGAPTAPLPAHMRSSPYQQGTYPASPYSSSPYSMGAYSGVTGSSQYEDQARRHQAAAALHNGTSSFLPPVCSSAYTQLQQLSAAYSQAASGKEVKKPAATSNNNYPFSHHA